MSQVQTGVKTHDDAVSKSEGVRQGAVVGASMSAVVLAEITHYRACLASAIANKCGSEPFVTALRSLGVNS
jgi:hypothetical protein